ncbi:hypothetical protein RSAG8_01362, partial [Rhizoctonia solani AG-8 WAC10335]
MCFWYRGSKSGPSRKSCGFHQVILVEETPVQDKKHWMKYMRCESAFGFLDFCERSHLTQVKSSDFDNNVKVFFVDTKALTLYEEYCAYGDLREYSRRITNNSEHKAIFRGLISGLHFLHTQNPPIVHGCVNPGNIYITEGLKVKLGEPSFSQLVVEHSHLTPSISVDWLVRWMSPEYFEESQPAALTRESDIWSLGCTFLEVMTGRLPYGRYKSNTEVLEQILTGVSPDLGVLEYPVAELETYPGFISQLAKKCWLPAPKRPNSSHISKELYKWDVMDYRLTFGANAPGSVGSSSMRGDATDGATARLYIHPFIPVHISHWRNELNIWCDRVHVRHIRFTSTQTAHRDGEDDAMFQAVPTFPKVIHRDSGIEYGTPAPLEDATVVGWGNTRDQAKEDSAKKLLQSRRYCYY